MKFTIDQHIFEKFPGLAIGVVVAKGIDNNGSAVEVETQLRAAEVGIRKEHSAETLSQTPRIDVWRKAYSAFGAKPKENRSSVENLYRLVLQGNDIRHISKLVDIYNLVSLRHMVPVGGEDIDRMSGDVALTFATANEAPVLLLGDREPRPPHAGEVIYKDSVSAICRRWNWREADRTKFTEGTKNCMLVIEGLPPVAKGEIESATVELEGLVKKFCGGDLSHVVLGQNKNEIEF